MSVRELEARLARDVEDAILGRLGYRETDVWLPGQTEPVDPRPEVVEVQSSETRQKLPEQVLVELNSGNRPNQVYRVGLPRTIPPNQVRVEGSWKLQTEGQAQTNCLVLAIFMEDARWQIYLCPIRRS